MPQPVRLGARFRIALCCIRAICFAIIRSYLDTLHKQGLNLLDALWLAFQEQPPQPATG